MQSNPVRDRRTIADVTTPDPVPAHPLESDFGWTLGVVSKAYRRIADDAINALPSGPRGYHVLAAVAGGQSPSQLALAQQLGVDKTVLVRLLDDLEGAKLLARRPDPADRRARQIVITAKGRQAVKRARDKLAAAEQELTDGLSAETLSTFKATLVYIARRTHGLAGEPDQR
jgi:DNA-binding MarR family transcriptional regulator